MSLFTDLNEKLKNQKELAKLLRDKVSFTDLNGNQLEINTQIINKQNILFLSLITYDKDGKKQSTDLAFSEDYMEFLILVMSIFKEDGNLLRITKSLNKITD